MVQTSSIVKSGFFQPNKPAGNQKCPGTEQPANPEQRTITMEQASWHDNASDCWIIIYDRVYDVTDFLDKHPGGAEIMLEYAGRDATIAFRGSGHSAQAVGALDRFIIGELPMHERIFRKPGGYRISDLPK